MRGTGDTRAASRGGRSASRRGLALAAAILVIGLGIAPPGASLDGASLDDSEDTLSTDNTTDDTEDTLSTDDSDDDTDDTLSTDDSNETTDDSDDTLLVDDSDDTSSTADGDAEATADADGAEAGTSSSTTADPALDADACQDGGHRFVFAASPGCQAGTQQQCSAGDCAPDSLFMAHQTMGVLRALYEALETAGKCVEGECGPVTVSTPDGDGEDTYVGDCAQDSDCDPQRECAERGNCTASDDGPPDDGVSPRDCLWDASCHPEDVCDQDASCGTGGTLSDPGLLPDATALDRWCAIHDDCDAVRLSHGPVDPDHAGGATSDAGHDLDALLLGLPDDAP